MFHDQSFKAEKLSILKSYQVTAMPRGEVRFKINLSGQEVSRIKIFFQDD